MKLSSQANLYLLCATLMWGITFPLIRNALHDVNVVTFVFLRFLLAVLILLPFISSFLKNEAYLTFGGLLIGFFDAVAYLSQTIKLKTVSFARATFIRRVASCFIWVPLLSTLFCLK